ncbi:MAG: metal ABC transporter solute-binding protein, Zn/Mn family [Solirubrobacteraceae bacterium]
MPGSHVHKAIAALMAILSALVVSACDRSGSAAAGKAGGAGRLEVVAAENVWGSIAAQLAGEKATVQSIIVNPATDPHSYQPTAQDARALAGASMVIVNGAGYDEWAQQLLRVGDSGGRVVVNVGSLLRLAPGANPHRWYFPADVQAVARRIATDYERLDPTDGAYFAQRERAFETTGLARYDELRREIRKRFAGVAVGYSESIFQGLGEDLGLKLLTPYSFVKAIAEGTDVTAADKQAVDAQARHRQIAVWVYNSQNLTPDVRRVNQIVREAQIPIATITETLAPASASFEQWQVHELEALLAALHEATGR